jgi:alkanesulfonate monooxygenase SsuD/methylene tetrahydromethanopterin reductase-like flavin-dependent oxidoreductase (luciferase family)
VRRTVGSRIGFNVQTWGTDLAALRRYVLASEELGYDAVWYGDGLWSWTHEGFSVLSALAALTTRVRLGPAVTYLLGDAYRHPSVLAKAATTLDLLSGGRLTLRIGAGAEDPETARTWIDHGIHYPSAKDRAALVAEGVRVLRALWTEDEVRFDGRFFTLDGAALFPRPAQQPHPPIWVAAMGDRMVRVAAALGDGWEASYLSPGAFARRRDVLLQGCEEVGRSGKELRRSLEVDVVIGENRRDVQRKTERYMQERGLGPGHPLLETALCGDADACCEKIQQFVRAGVTDFTLGFSDFPSTEMLSRFAATVIPEMERVDLGS